MPNLIYIITFSFYWLVDSRVNSKPRRTQLTFSSTEFLLLVWLMSHGKSVVHFLLVLSIINVPGGVWSSLSVACSVVSSLLTLSSFWMSEVWQGFRDWAEGSASHMFPPFSLWSISHDSITSFPSPENKQFYFKLHRWPWPTTHQISSCNSRHRLWPGYRAALQAEAPCCHCIRCRTGGHTTCSDASAGQTRTACCSPCSCWPRGPGSRGWGGACPCPRPPQPPSWPRWLSTPPRSSRSDQTGRGSPPSWGRSLAWCRPAWGRAWPPAGPSGGCWPRPCDTSGSGPASAGAGRDERPGHRCPEDHSRRPGTGRGPARQKRNIWK